MVSEITVFPGVASLVSRRLPKLTSCGFQSRPFLALMAAEINITFQGGREGGRLEVSQREAAGGLQQSWFNSLLCL